MKIRNGFVSNSSSSSYVIIDYNSGKYDEFNTEGKQIYTIGEHGCTEFGWTPEKIQDVHSRINFAYLQAITDEWTLMLRDVIQEFSPEILIVRNIISGEWSGMRDRDTEFRYGYIDHASSACEGINIEIFENKEALKHFLFGSGSYIQVDNDNY